MDLPEENQSLPRRRFFINGIKALAALFGLGLGIPLAGFFISPALKKDKHDWIEIADSSLLKDGEPSRINYSYARKDGWKTAQTPRTAFVVKQASGEFAAFSNRCTHLGCGVNWDSALKQFKCPCHGGVFDAQGRVVEGPPPKALTRLALKVEANKIFVMEA
ncbi:MAG: ubiquinol-cytochrome c reductase iron-sulfur subunit [Desulfovibrio sp.]|nr:ubiquinol-cytochrome c reductase iron-sulfur subunit [Desulfovibrio sp.]